MNSRLSSASRQSYTSSVTAWPTSATPVSKIFGGELAHPLYAVVHIRDGLGHQFTGAFFFQRRPALPHQIGIQNASSGG